jgi:hypothetical protein
MGEMRGIHFSPTLFDEFAKHIDAYEAVRRKYAE